MMYTGIRIDIIDRMIRDIQVIDDRHRTRGI